MIPYCKKHSDKPATYFCKLCGFICQPEDEDKNQHNVIAVSQNVLTFIHNLSQEITRNFSLFQEQNKSELDALIKDVAQEIDRLESKDMEFFKALIESDNSFIPNEAKKLLKQINVLQSPMIS